MSGRGRHRDVGRHHPSGNAKRKAKNEKEKKDSLATAKSRKLTEYFAGNPSTALAQSETWNEFHNESSESEQEVPSSSHENPSEAETSISDDARAERVDLHGQRLISMHDSDIGLWPETIEVVAQDYWIVNGSKDCQNIDADFSLSQQIDGSKHRSCTKSLFTHEHKLTQEKRERTWLCYSPTRGALFCFACKVMNMKGQKFSVEGFSDWKHAARGVQQHETSQSHRTAVISLLNRKAQNQCVDSKLTEEIEEEKAYWVKVLNRIVSVISFLAERGLAFRGDEEVIGSVHNGNYLGTLELLAKFDPFLQEHLNNFAHKGKGNPSYLSHIVCDEFIGILAEEVKGKIIKELQHCKYFSISLDSTPDIAHVDQLSLIVRYVLPTGPVERFVKYLDMEGHAAAQMLQSLKRFFEEHHIDITYLRGQSYDNASNMSGRYNGLQAKVKAECPFADFIPCYGHSLNLVGTCCAESCQQAVLFFNFVSSLYNFFSASTARWDALAKEMKKNNQVLTLKRLCGTRWSERADATKALLTNYGTVETVLEELSSSDNQKPEARLQAEGLLNSLNKLETGIMLIFWNKILQRFQMTSASLQAEDLCLNSAQSLLKSLSPFVESIKQSFLQIESDAKDLTSCEVYQEERKRSRRRNPRYDDSANIEDTASISPSKKFEQKTFNVIIENLLSELSKRQSAYEKLCNTFGILHSLPDASEEELSIGATNLITSYPNDLEVELHDELIQFSALLKTDIAKEIGSKHNREAQYYSLIKAHELEPMFPNVDVALRIYLSLMVSNCSGERSFSKLKRVKNEQRASMGQDRLNNLSLLSIEHELLRSLHVNEIISKFAAQKARKRVC